MTGPTPRCSGAPPLVPGAGHGWYGASGEAVESVFAATLDLVRSRTS
ncbi:hypothetical protein SALCHL_004166 [Streptomyces albus subsp. chlorinus]|nr:hypothetical protein [Streptomyces albus]